MKKHHTWNYPPFKFDESGDAKPVLFLATRSERAPQWNFKPGREWHWIEHQCAGVGCNQRELVGTILPWRDGMLEKFQALAEQFDGTDAGVFGVRLSTINAYASALREIDPALTCEESYPEFVEALYPIDVTREAIAALTADALPEDLNLLVEWRNELEPFLGCVGRWRLYVLAQNSD